MDDHFYIDVSGSWVRKAATLFDPRWSVISDTPLATSSYKFSSLPYPLDAEATTNGDEQEILIPFG